MGQVWAQNQPDLEEIAKWIENFGCLLSINPTETRQDRILRFQKEMVKQFRDKFIKDT